MSNLLPRLQNYSQASSLIQIAHDAQIDRISLNLSRLYARRVLTLLAAASTSARRLCELESQLDYSKTESFSSTQIQHRNSELVPRSKFKYFIKGAARCLYLGALFVPLVALYPLENTDRFYNYAIWALEKAGPTYIKLAQWASTRTDLFGEDVVKLAKLRDRTTPHSLAYTLKLLREANILNVIEMEEEVIGSGCIAQVYRGRLKEDQSLDLRKGDTVAIKVQHPNIVEKVLLDFMVLRKGADFLECLPFLKMNYLSLKDSIDQFYMSMVPQLNLLNEADNLQRFRENFQSDHYIRFPKPIFSLTTDKVLLESFCNGVSINDVHLGGDQELKQYLAGIGLDMVMRMIFYHDFVHGDLHPGNILIDLNDHSDEQHDIQESFFDKMKKIPTLPKKYPNLRMNVIDCGLIVQLGASEHKNLIQVLGSFIKSDGHRAGELMIDTSKDFGGSKLDRELFCRGIQRIVDDDQDNNFLENVGDYLADICFLACRHRVKLEGSFINAALAVEIMEGIASSLYPDMQVRQIALPMVLKAELMHGLKQATS